MFTVFDEDMFENANAIGQAVLPLGCREFPSIRAGYRSVPLRNIYSEEMELASLFVHVTMTYVECEVGVLGVTLAPDRRVHSYGTPSSPSSTVLRQAVPCCARASHAHSSPCTSMYSCGRVPAPQDPKNSVQKSSAKVCLVRLEKTTFLSSFRIPHPRNIALLSLLRAVTRAYL